MQRRVVVSLARLFRDEVPGALPRGRLNDGLPRLKGVHARLTREPPEPLPSLERVLAAVTWLQARAEVIVVVGQPGALLAVRAWLDALAPGALVRFVGGPDAELLDAGRGVALVALVGPDWVDAAVEAAVAAGRPVVVAGPTPDDLEDGEVVDPPSGGLWLDDPHAGDGRFGILGAAALVIAGFAGIDVAALIDGADEMLVACTKPALTENPAYSYALGCIYAERELGLRVPAHVTSNPRLETFVVWAARTWATTMTGASSVAGLRARSGGAPLAGLLGDEELTELLLEGPREFLLTTWEHGPSAHDDALLAVSRDRPSVRILLFGGDARAMGAAAALMCRAAIAGGLLTDRDPRTLVSLSRWREAVMPAVDAGEPAE